MFFIIGVSNAERILEFDQPMVCPCCARFGRLQASVSYMYFSLFFIPLIKWNKRYFVKATCCGAVAELDCEIGRSIERGETNSLDLNSLHFSCPYDSAKRCAACGYETAEDFQYCPKCGRLF